MTAEKIIKSKKASPETRSWREYILREQQETPSRLEDAAKFLAAMISISLSMFLAIGKTTFSDCANNAAVKWSISLWMLSLIAAFLVLFPWPRAYASVSADSIKKMHKRMARQKYALLIASSVLFLAALFILACLFLMAS